MQMRFMLIGSLLLSGCTTLSETYLVAQDIATHSYLTTTSHYQRSSSWVLSRQTKFYLARNSELTELNTQNSTALTDTLRSAIAANFANVRVGMLAESFPQAQQSADRLGADFIIYPSIVSWNDKAGTWSEIYQTLKIGDNEAIRSSFGLDDVQVQIIIQHVVTGSLFDVVMIDATSGLLTLYDDKPQSVLLPQLRSFFASLVATSG